MYACPKCNLKTKQLNGLMTKHFKKHVTNEYSKEQYKVDTLALNGRPPQNCKICGKQTKIPKGEAEYPSHCKECYLNILSSGTGSKNFNWKGGKSLAECAFCGETRTTYASQLEGQNTFCSASCSTKFYCQVENMSEAKRNFFLQGRSKKENDCFELVRNLFPDAIPSFHLGYYNFDIYIPSNSMLIEFDGKYWHSLAKTKINDKRKTTFINKYYPSYFLVRILEEDWDSANDKRQFILDLLSRNS